MTSKQRANLRSMASKLEPAFQIGKGNISPELKEGIADNLDKNELIKISILKASELSAKEAGEMLAATLKAVFVCDIGNKVVLYKKSKRDIKHIEF